MSNQLQHKAATLAQILANNRLTKSAEQEIEHKGLLEQDSLGAEQTQDLHENVEGTLADTPAAKNPASGTPEQLPGVQSLTKEPEAALASTGTEVDTMKEDGTETGTPAEVAKTASLYRKQLAGIMKQMSKAATAKQAAQEPQKQIVTGVEVMQKFASLTPTSTKEDLEAAKDLLTKLASTNPVFSVCRDRILMSKMAEDIDALAEAEGISPEEAAAELQAAADANPEMTADLEDEATGEAVADLADAEVATDQFMGGVQQMADNASQALGVEVTPDDIVDAAEQTVQLAEQLGVEPEVLIQQAMEELQGAGDAEVTPEDEANAQAILDEAAANGISPEEVIQMAAGELEGAPEAATEEAVPEAAPATESEEKEEKEPEEKVEKEASLQKRAKTMRAAFVQELRRNRK